MFLGILGGKAAYFAGGILVAAVGSKAVKSGAVRELCVRGIATGMKMKMDARKVWQNVSEDAADLCHDAKTRLDDEGYVMVDDEESDDTTPE